METETKIDNTTFKSGKYPEMDPFLRRLEVALNRITYPHPRPCCDAFAIAIHDRDLPFQYMIEEIGIIPPEKKWKYKYIAINEMMHVLFSGILRSKEIADESIERFQSGIKFGDKIAGVASAHDRRVDEAIALLYLIALSILEAQRYNLLGNQALPDDFWVEIREIAYDLNLKNFPDNRRITELADLLFL